MATYWEKLKDPRWQRMRLKVFERAGFECEDCGATDRTLHAHHKLYRKGADPWEYEDAEIFCLCDECHEATHHLRAVLNHVVAGLRQEEISMLIGYGLAIQARVDPTIDCRLCNYESVQGAADAFRISAKAVVDAIDDECINGFALARLRDEAFGKTRQ